jgi:hypothetical protein
LLPPVFGGADSADKTSDQITGTDHPSCANLAGANGAGLKVPAYRAGVKFKASDLQGLRQRTKMIFVHWMRGILHSRKG